MKKNRHGNSNECWTLLCRCNHSIERNRNRHIQLDWTKWLYINTSKPNNTKCYNSKCRCLQPYRYSTRLYSECINHCCGKYGAHGECRCRSVHMSRKPSYPYSDRCYNVFMEQRDSKWSSIHSICRNSELHRDRHSGRMFGNRPSNSDCQRFANCKCWTRCGGL